MTRNDPRHDGRSPSQLRDIVLTRHCLDHAEVSVLVDFGRTRVLCAASFPPGFPPWRTGPAAAGAQARAGLPGRSGSGGRWEVGAGTRAWFSARSMLRAIQ